MTKRKKDYQLTSEPLPTATNLTVPVFVPDTNGDTKIDIGTGRLRSGTLVVEFKESFAARAIQNMLERGNILGFGMIMLRPDVVNEMYQEVVANEEAEAERIKQGLLDGTLILDEDGKAVPVDSLVTESTVIAPPADDLPPTVIEE